MNENVHILVVDDNKHNLKIASNFLQGKGYQIALALNGESALEIVESTKIDLILLDIMMPGMNGFEVCRLLKKNIKTKDIPVIFLSAKTEPEDIVKGFELGGADYITKPFHKDELFARVNNHIQLKQIRDLLREDVNKMLKSDSGLVRLISEITDIVRSKN